MNLEYKSLTDIVNCNLIDNAINELVFELPDNLEENIYNYPCYKLLCIEDNKQFLCEVYYKILDRVIDKDSFDRLYDQLEQNKITKSNIIKNISNSEESKIKKTKINFDKVETLG